MVGHYLPDPLQCPQYGTPLHLLGRAPLGPQLLTYPATPLGTHQPTKKPCNSLSSCDDDRGQTSHGGPQNKTAHMTWYYITHRGEALCLDKPDVDDDDDNDDGDSMRGAEISTDVMGAGTQLLTPGRAASSHPTTGHWAAWLQGVRNTWYTLRTFGSRDACNGGTVTRTLLSVFVLANLCSSTQLLSSSNQQIPL